MTGPFKPIQCCIVGCKRTTSKWPDGEIICARCWKAVSRRARRFYKIAYGQALQALERAVARRAGAQTALVNSGLPVTPMDQNQEVWRLMAAEEKAGKRYYRMTAMAWGRCKREATEARGGLR